MPTDFRQKITQIMLKINEPNASMSPMSSQKVDPTALAGYVRRTLDAKGMETSEVQERARRLGWEIHQSYVSRIVSGKAGHLTVPKLQALAAGLGVSEDEIFAIARGIEKPTSYTSTEFYVLYERASLLRDRWHSELIQQMVSMINRKAEEFLEEEAGDPPRDNGRVASGSS